MTKGLEVLDKMESVETTRDGIFVMPKERITIFSTYVYSASSLLHAGGEAFPAAACHAANACCYAASG